MRGSRVAAGLLWLVFAALPVRAGETPSLLADINRAPADPSSASLSEEPSGFFPLGGRLLFSTAGSRTDEGILWSTDGTAAATVQVSSSLCPAPCRRISSLAFWHGIALLQTATGDFGGIFLARTDGTTAGTLLLTGDGAVDPVFAGELFAPPDAGAFYFKGCLPSSQCQLWQSDGTRAGTRVVLGADLLPFDNPHSLVARGNRLAFMAYHGPRFIDGLWTTDGTPEGTALLSEISESPDTEARVVATPSHLFFTSGERGEDLWVTDGTPGSARLLADFAPPACYDFPSHYCDTPDVDSLAAEGDAVDFVTYRQGHGAEVWHSDGTVEGTRPLLELPAGLYPDPPHRLGARWIFPVASASQPTLLWTAGEGLAQAAPLAGCDGGDCPGFHGFLAGPEGGRQLFAGEDAAHGVEIWSTDGTPAGTRRLADSCPGPCSGLRLAAELFPFLFPGPTGITYFQAYPSADAADGTGDELWITDGTPGGTRRVAGHTSDVGFLGGLTYFGTGHPRRPASELWATDGKPGGVRRVAVLRRFAASSFPLFQPFRDGALLLPVDEDGSHQLWKSDGTPAGTVPLYDFAPGRSFPSLLGPLGSLQLLAVLRKEGEGPARVEIWRTDGSVPGTQRVIGLGPRQGLDLPAVPWAGKLLFDVQTAAGCAYWSSDGTPAGTRQILPPLPGVRCPASAAPRSSPASAPASSSSPGLAAAAIRSPRSSSRTARGPARVRSRRSAAPGARSTTTGPSRPAARSSSASSASTEMPRSGAPTALPRGPAARSR
jgi:ELWxxDGT repeat protein